MTKVEEVARAMAASDSGPIGSLLFQIHWKEFGEGYIANARAAIEAMREPTDLMGNGLPTDYRPGSHSATHIWRAMIDAALSESAI